MFTPVVTDTPAGFCLPGAVATVSAWLAGARS
jgi:hypothetical protein